MTRIKRAILAACIAAFALAALPALALAEPVTSNPGDPIFVGVKEGDKFTTSGGEAKLTGAVGTIKCKKNGGSGEFFDPETGSFTQTFEECTGPLGVICTTSGQKSGVIKTTTLPFHLKTVEHPTAETKTPGILVTPGPEEVSHGKHFATFECPFVGKIVVGGTGLVGTITKPAEGFPSNTGTLVFSATEPGSITQTHRKVTNALSEYDLVSSIGGGETKTAAEDAEGTIRFQDPSLQPYLATTELK